MYTPSAGVIRALLGIQFQLAKGKTELFDEIDLGSPCRNNSDKKTARGLELQWNMKISRNTVMSLFLIPLATVHGRRSHVLVDACGSLHPSSALVCGTECVVSFSFLLYVERKNSSLQHGGIWRRSCPGLFLEAEPGE